MADGGIGEAALLAAAAEASAGAAAAGGTAALAAATLPEVAAAGGALAGTAAAAAPEIAAAAVAPELVAAAPEAFAATSAAEPVFLGATSSEPVAGGLLSGATTGTEAFGPPTASQSLLGMDIGFGPGNVAPGWAGETLPAGASLPSTPTIATGEYAPGLLDKLGTWWDKATLGDKLSAGGKLLSGVGTAAKAATPSTPTKGSTNTIRSGTTGKPQGGEQALAAIVDAMLKRRDAYQQGQLGGVPVVYRPRGLLG